MFDELMKLNVVELNFLLDWELATEDIKLS